MSAKNYFPWQQLICKVQSALNAAVDLIGEEKSSRSADYPGGCHGILAGKKYFMYLEKGGGVRTNSVEPSLNPPLKC